MLISLEANMLEKIDVESVVVSIKVRIDVTVEA